MRGRMHKDLRANPRIGENEANGVVDASRGELVGIEEQRRDGEAGGVGTGALISTSRWRINPVEIPNRHKVLQSEYCLRSWPGKLRRVCHGCGRLR